MGALVEIEVLVFPKGREGFESGKVARQASELDRFGIIDVVRDEAKEEVVWFLLSRMEVALVKVLPIENRSGDGRDSDERKKAF